MYKPTVFFFPNGNTAVCRDGLQVPELQESWLLLFVKFLQEQGVDPEEFEYKLPSGDAKLVKLDDGSFNWRFND